MNDKLLKAHYFQIIDLEDKIILRKGSLVTEINGRAGREIIKTILKLLNDAPRSLEFILNHFPEAFSDKIKTFLLDLVEKNLLYWVDHNDPKSYSSSHLDNFYWNFRSSESEVNRTWSTKKFAIVGLNYISRHLINTLLEMALSNFFVVDDPQLRNFNICDNHGTIDETKWTKQKVKIIGVDGLEVNKPDCIIATTDLGTINAVRKWHQYSFVNDIHFLPITLADAIGQIGPLVIPKQTACYECFLARTNSNFENHKSLNLLQDSFYQDQFVVGFHPSLPTIVADFSLIELGKFYGQWLPSHLVNAIIEVNLVDLRLNNRKILKLPKCSICSPNNFRSSTSPDNKDTAASLFAR